MTAERRSVERHELYLGAKLEAPGTGERNAITMDISERGLLLLTRAQLTDGEPLSLQVYLPTSDEPLQVEGRVLRHKPLGDDESNLWREKVAVEFSEPQTMLARDFADHAARQQAAFRRRR